MYACLEEEQGCGGRGGGGTAFTMGFTLHNPRGQPQQHSVALHWGLSYTPTMEIHL